MKKDKNEKIADSSCLTINGITYKTSGNILFCESEEDGYIIAESPLLDKVDRAIQEGILENGMQTLLRKVSEAK